MLPRSNPIEQFEDVADLTTRNLASGTRNQRDDGLISLPTLQMLGLFCTGTGTIEAGFACAILYYSLLPLRRFYRANLAFVLILKKSKPKP